MYQAKFSKTVYYNVVINEECNCVDFSLDVENEVKRIWLGVADFLNYATKL